MLDKHELKELETRVDEVLFYVWDPIGVRNEPCARSEYSSYTTTVLKYLLVEDLDKIVEQLGKIESTSMGLKINDDNNIQVAQLLIEYKHAIEEGLR